MGEHAGDDERFAAHPVGEDTGVELADALDGGVEGGEDPDAADRQAGLGEQDGEQAPGEAVVEVVDQPGPGAGGQRWFAEGREGEDLPARPCAIDVVGAAGVGRRFVPGVVAGLSDEQDRQAEAEAEGGVGEAEEERFRSQAPGLCDVAGGQGGEGDGAVAGSFVLPSAASPAVESLWVALSEVTQAHLNTLDDLARAYLGDRSRLDEITRPELLARLRAEDVIVLDVRPAAEFAAGHIAHARSVPIDELSEHLEALPPDVEVVAYCRGPYCVYADDAVRLLRRTGRRARRLTAASRNGGATGSPRRPAQEPERRVRTARPLACRP